MSFQTPQRAKRVPGNSQQTSKKGYSDAHRLSTISAINAGVITLH